ncbi:MAG: glycosyltransferase family 4 protein [bacterium]
MRVCMLTTSFPRWRGDLSGNFIESLSKSLVKRGVEIEVVAPGHKDATGRDEMGGVRVRRFTYAVPSRLQVVSYGGGIPHKLKTSNLARVELLQFMVSMLREALVVARKCDIIHAHWIPSGVVAALLAKGLSLPTVLTVHGSDAALIRGGILMRALSRFSLVSASQVIAVSRTLTKTILGFRPGIETVKTIHNGVELELFPFVERRLNTRRLLWAGRMTEEKGVAYLIRAMKKVASADPLVTLCLVGNGPLRSKLEALTCELGLSSHIAFIGEKPRSELPRMYAWCDAVVMPSLSEGLPMVLLEAMAVGRPVVASSVGGIPELVKHGETGHLVSPGSVDELADGIIQLLERPDLMGKMGVASRKLVEAAHSWDRVASDVHSVYKELCKT